MKNELVNKEIINKNGDKGIIVSFDGENIVVEYPKETKTYNLDVAFKSGFLSFSDDKYNQRMVQELSAKEELEKQKEETYKNNSKISINRRKKVNETYKILSQKGRVLKGLFGSDFEYPPLKKFVKRYRFLIEEKNLLDFDKWIVRDKGYHYYYYF